ncbi:MAG: phosphate ABC transporter permease subunit PstC [Chthoniobacterales bacterium]|nr:phosphate ABC transporter permease subunit PstC [Chthoniobacterales bacterium]
MNGSTVTVTSPPAAHKVAARGGRTGEALIRLFFGGNAIIAVVVLVLITLFLFREGFGFFGGNLQNLRVYRSGGLEYVDIIRDQADANSALSRALSDVRVKELRGLMQKGRSLDEANGDLGAFDQFATAFSDAGTDLAGLVSDLTDQAAAVKEQTMLGSGAASVGPEDGETPSVTPAVAATVESIRASYPDYERITATMSEALRNLLANPPALTTPLAQEAFNRVNEKTREYLAAFPAQAERLRAWDPAKPVRWHQAITAFLFDQRWITASFWQDWYGIVPLLVGSIMVSIVALILAVPFGVASAIYVSEIATRPEQRLIKPYIEFIAAIPSVVLGFFGIAVVGQAIRTASESTWFHWVSFFPLSERLNVFTAGALLGLMAVPTIFTLSEDALRNVPRGFKEASYALGANRLQTIGRVIVPASLSGIMSAILLGLGRVIGETMVVLLCAGNRIAIPDFTQGLGAFFQPVHTMTGIIAQEMGEVVRGSIHYRALFMVGLVLFALTLLINLAAQRIAARYRMSIG